MRGQDKRVFENIDFEIEFLNKEFTTIKVAYRDRIFTPSIAKQQLLSLYERTLVLLRIAEGTEFYSRAVDLKSDVQFLVRTF